ncbi:type II secretion system protein [Prosthecobacter dejongeii]|uniref:Type II secretory pathway pseudopilin PulG n=1 Tax=Prosthecobacter dejongeii TaxID=48465 RepID=A0A7W7YGW8_9BACT|nr:type II secretion system protein [Prosthecobacter dejongeii]MBB5035996.1 type II secretory pathway pseudopilin PulG [Prosthecobacter dejongeii]
MKIDTHTVYSRRLAHRSGMTLIEISLVIALLLGLIAVVFLGIGSYRQGADKAKCKMQLAAVQKAVRSGANMQNLAALATLAEASVFGAGQLMENEPVCPSGGDYTWQGTVPAVGVPYGNCDFAGTGPTSTHVLAAADTTDW